MPAGRPPSSYAYPKLWAHVRELGLEPSTRAIRRLKSQAPSNRDLGLQTNLAVRLIEKKLSQKRPWLLEFNTAYDLHTVISYFRRRDGLTVDTPANDIVRFDHRVVGLTSLTSGRVSEIYEKFEEIAVRAGLTLQIVIDASKGKLLPPRICNDIFAAAEGRHGISVEQAEVSKQVPPSTDADVLSSVMAKLASVP